MGAEWRSDFSFSYFRRILEAMKFNFEHHLISGALHALLHDGKRPKLFLRHDIDLDLNKALEMAMIENEHGVRATYMVMVNSPFYRVEETASRLILRRLVSLGHEVALHFDFATAEERNGHPERSSIESKIHSACGRLEATIEAEVQSISSHRPLPQLLRGPLIVAGRVNAYSKELMAWYLSDSKGTWREGEPLPRLQHPDQPLLQLLIHPIWWGNEHGPAPERLQAFFEASTQGGSREQINAFDASLSNHLGVRRKGIAVRGDQG